MDYLKNVDPRPGRTPILLNKYLSTLSPFYISPNSNNSNNLYTRPKLIKSVIISKLQTDRQAVIECQPSGDNYL